MKNPYKNDALKVRGCVNVSQQHRRKAFSRSAILYELAYPAHMVGPEILSGLTQGAGRQSDQLCEASNESAKATVTHIETNVCNMQGGGQQ
jgi:hypothetical protein